MDASLSFNERLKRIQSVTHTRTQAELADILEVKQSSVSDAKKRNSIPAEWYMKLFEKLGVSPDWLKKGMGPIYLRTEAGYIPSDGEGTPIDPALLGSPLAQSALATVHTMRGTHAKCVTSAADLQPTGKICLPKSYARGGMIVLEVDSEAAAPTVRRGAHVGINTFANHPSSGELFAVSLPHEGIVLRKLFLDSKNECVMLRAENSAYPDIRIHSDITDQILGRLAWVMQEV